MSFRIVLSLWNLTGTSAAVLPMCLSNFKAIRQFKVPSSWLRDFTRSYEKTSFRILRRGPVSFPSHHQVFNVTDVMMDERMGIYVVIGVVIIIEMSGSPLEYTKRLRKYHGYWCVVFHYSNHFCAIVISINIINESTSILGHPCGTNDHRYKIISIYNIKKFFSRGDTCHV